MKKLFFYSCLLFSVFSLAQEHHYVDTITAQDSIKIATYRAKLSQYVNPIPDSAFFYGNKIKTLATQLNYGKAIADSDYFLGACFKRVQENDSAITSFKKSLALSETLNYNIGISRAYNSLGRTYYLLGKMDSSIIACKKAISTIKADSKTAIMIIADSHTAVATAYSRKNDMNNAIIHLLKVDSMHQKSSLRPDIIAAAYQNLGSIYLDLEEYPTAIEQFKKANDQFEKLPNVVSQFYKNTTNIFLGKAYLKTEKTEKADSLLTKSYSYFKQADDKRLVAEIAGYLGQLALKKNEPLKAETFFIESFTIHKDNDQPLEAAQGALKIAKLELYKNQPKSALNYLKEANYLNLTADNSKLKQELLFYKAQAYNQQGNYKEAYKYSNQAKKLQDSLQNVQSAEKIKEIESIYQTERRDKEIALLITQNNLAEEQKANQRNLFIAAISVTSLAALFFFFQYRNRQKTNQKLRELDAAKSTFFTNISHDFRTPLTLIKGPIEDQLENPSLSLINRKNLNAAFKNTERLENLVSQLMSLSKLNSSAIPLQVQPVNIDAFLKVNTQGFQYQSEEQGLHFSLTTNVENNEIWLDQDILEKILYNLLGNALKYTSENGNIEINGSTSNGVFQLNVYNTAQAISEKEKKLLFKRFYQANPYNQGAGIGLSLIKQLVTLHKGSITVKNKKEGIVFIVEIPINKGAYNQNEILNESLYSNIETKIEDVEENTPLIEMADDAPVLLVVDDTKDIQDYIKSIFQDEYKVFTSNDGEEGCKLANKHIPDIIISDIMMPVMDGYDLTKHIKENPITSHIPIILLTAKNKEVDQLEAMGIGADIYITKPFSSKILKANVASLIENRRKLQERFSQELILTPKDIAVTTADEEFLSRLQEILDKYITQTDFTASKFSEVMLMNRMQLHRKLKALTGLSSSEFIKNQRLKIAAQLIKTKDLNISEVGYSIGFNDPSYFAKCFKQEYGISPKEFAKKHTQNPL